MEYKDKIFNKMDKILESKKQMILYGVPGVGKTYLARTFVDKFLDNNLNSNKDISKNAQDNTKEANAHIIRDICYLIYKEGIDSEEKIIKKIDSINNKNYWKYPPTVSHKTKIKSSLKKAENLNLIERKNNKLILSKKGNELVNLLNDGNVYTHKLSDDTKKFFFQMVSDDRLNSIIGYLLHKGNIKYNLLKKSKTPIGDDLLFWASGITPIKLKGREDDYTVMLDRSFFGEIGIRNNKRKKQENKNGCFIMFHQSFNYEEFIEGLKPKTNDKSDIIYDVDDGMFKKRCILAIWEVLKNKERLPLEEILEIFKKEYPKGSELETDEGKKFKINRLEDKNIEVKKRSRKYDITFEKLEMLWNENIKNVNDVEQILKIDEKEEIEFYYTIYKKLEKIETDINKFYNLIKQKVIDAIKNKELTKDDFQNAPKYYLIIDEINRGNISNILGELITLLEKDKRLGEDNEIIIDLPYSKEPFAVPPNLYIIGTMNTADKSIALLDTALRRRFGFLEIEPNYDLITKDNLINVWKEKCNDKEFNKIKKEDIEKMFQKLGNDEFLKKLLETINTKITLLKDRDHRIGHSYFLNVKDIDDLRFVWYNEIIPLLMEYFYNDWESLKEILKGFVKSEKPNIKINYDLIDDDLKLYEIKEYEGEEFIKALNSVIT